MDYDCSETTEGQPPLQTDGGPAYASDQRDQRVEVGERDGCLRHKGHKGHKHRSHRRSVTAQEEEEEEQEELKEEQAASVFTKCVFKVIAKCLSTRFHTAKFLVMLIAIIIIIIIVWLWNVPPLAEVV
ncbi:unnamed protein product [Arctogadus glacialis]